jgi:hypothetical protein
MENYVDRNELRQSIDDGSSPSSSRRFYDLSKEVYDKVINSKRNISVKIGKNSPCFDPEEDEAERGITKLINGENK